MLVVSFVCASFLDMQSRTMYSDLLLSFICQIICIPYFFHTSPSVWYQLCHIVVNIKHLTF